MQVSLSCGEDYCQFGRQDYSVQYLYLCTRISHPEQLCMAAMGLALKSTHEDMKSFVITLKQESCMVHMHSCNLMTMLQAHVTFITWIYRSHRKFFVPSGRLKDLVAET